MLLRIIFFDIISQWLVNDGSIVGHIAELKKTTYNSLLERSSFCAMFVDVWKGEVNPS